jgi:hypothetical protein
MAYLSFASGTPIAFITGGELDGEVVHLLDPDIDRPKRRNEQHITKLKLPDGKIFPLPSETSEQLYISGPNGSGKTYYVAKYLELFRSLYPEKSIYLFSDVKQDPLLDKIKCVERINLERSDDPDKPDILEDPITPEDLKDSLVVFDDIDSISDKDIMKAVNSLKDKLLKTSRHNNIYVIVTNHLSCDYKQTRTVINECKSITIFPKSGASNQITRMCKDYCGLTKSQIEMVFSLPSRWVTIHKNYPVYVTYDHGVTLL